MAEWLNRIIEVLSGIMTDLVAAVIIILIGFILGRVLGKLTHKLLHEFEIDRLLNAKPKKSIEKGVSKFVAYFIYFLTAIAALNQMGLTTTILHMVSAAVLIVVVLSILLGIKDFIPNFLAGMHIQKGKMISEGDFISVIGTEGKVVGIELTKTKLKTKKGDIIFIPNSTLIKEKVVKKKK